MVKISAERVAWAGEGISTSYTTPTHLTHPTLARAWSHPRGDHLRDHLISFNIISYGASGKGLMQRQRSIGHAQMASTAIIAAPRLMATIFTFKREHDMGFTPHTVSENSKS